MAGRRLRRASIDEHLAIGAMASEAYAALGSYGDTVASWLVHPGVKAYVHAAGDGALRAFVLLAYFEPLSASNPKLLVDLLALAVRPEDRGQGLGRHLLREAIELASEAATGFGRADLRLTVSDDNDVAQHLFSSEGFSILDPNHSVYDQGQRAIRMTQALRIA